MGQTYSVEMFVRALDRRNAVKAMRKYMAETSERVDYSLERRKSFGYTTRSFDDMARVFLADWPGQPMYTIPERGGMVYGNMFTASYGWEPVMLGMFEAIAPHVGEGSYIEIEGDNSCVREVVTSDNEIAHMEWDLGEGHDE